ncbi:hypothetical protein HMN09_00521900 [Mycena chlorophos]|uniref:Uncharacterized protein n=1 Tax=Mycena chlorophos TaxID=658473 RepID=A0A8H6TA96_MYCCL|nr:hypothetical protein HMN09_00521900 [Mycena chlorophos]
MPTASHAPLGLLVLLSSAAVFFFLLSFFHTILSIIPMSNPSPNRASLLSGLRTGGVVRSADSRQIPATAAPGGSFNVPRVSTGLHNSSIFPEEEDMAQSAHRIPMTAAIDGGFMHQQLNPNSAPFTPFMAQPPQAFQQMMQLELLRMQAQQQLQAQMYAQAQLQTPRRASYNPPATAGPLNTSFDLRSATLSAQMRRASQAASEQQVPMTAGLDGKFGSRLTLNDPPSTPNTTVISGGTSLGSPASTTTPSKSDSANSWRRGSNSVLNGNNRSPSVKITPPTESPAPLAKSRPQPLSFNPVSAIPVVAIDSADGDIEDDETSSSEKSGPATPTNVVPLSPREEATKKLYEGLGIGRPVVAEQALAAVPVPARLASQPVRQPRGPPSGADELGSHNFAARIRRKAIGGLGVLMTSRERREAELVEAY